MKSTFIVLILIFFATTSAFASTDNESKIVSDFKSLQYQYKVGQLSKDSLNWEIYNLGKRINKIYPLKTHGRFVDITPPKKCLQENCKIINSLFNYFVNTRPKSKKSY